MKGLKELLMSTATKQKKTLGEDEIAAKMGALDDIESCGDENLGKKLSKVTVAAKSPEDLKKGLGMAEELVDKKMPTDEEGLEHEMDEKVKMMNAKKLEPSSITSPFEDLDVSTLEGILASLQEAISKKKMAE